MTFDDFLGLTGRDLTPFRLILFHGRSGSGKSTAIEFLLQNHFRGVHARVIDEITTFGDLVRRRKEFRGSGPLLIATHVHPRWFRMFARGPFAVFHTDRDQAKVARHLERLGLSASPRSVEEYVRRFGATYTDVDLILERCPSRDFDRSLAAFLKLHRIDTR